MDATRSLPGAESRLRPGVCSRSPYSITPLTGVVVTITGHNTKVAFDGAEHSVTGYDVKISNPLYQESGVMVKSQVLAAGNL